MRQLAEYCRENPDAYKTVVVDHISGMQDLVLREILGLEELPAQLGWGTASQQQWGTVATQTKEHLRSMLDLPQHVVLVAQEREFEADKDSSLGLTPTIGSAVSPSVAGWLFPACDYICQTYIRGRTEKATIKIGGKETPTIRKVPGVDYCLRIAPHEVYTTKVRKPKGRELPDEIVDPDFAKLIKVITG
jgi:hypothetical protein